MDLFEGLDWGTYAFFQFQAKQAPGFVHPVMMVGDWLGSYLGAAALLMVAVTIAPQHRRRRLGLVSVILFLVGGLLVEGLKQAIARPRPPDAQNVLGPEMTSSFPSRPVFFATYAALMVVVALQQWTQSRLKRVALHALGGLVVIFVCVSELWLGLHFVTDVIPALTGGIGLALVARWLATDPAPTLV